MMNYQKAKKLTTQKEFSLVERSQEDLTLRALSSLISRARKLRNKYVDLSRRQSIKNKPGAGVPERTAEKSELFQSVVVRLEKKLEAKQKIAKSKKKVARPQQEKKKLKSKVKRVDPPSGEIKGEPGLDQPKDFSQKTRAKRKTKRIARASSKRILGHVSSRNKRSQKRRDLKNG